MVTLSSSLIPVDVDSIRIVAHQQGTISGVIFRIARRHFAGIGIVLVVGLGVLELGKLLGPMHGGRNSKLAVSWDEERLEHSASVHQRTNTASFSTPSRPWRY